MKLTFEKPAPRDANLAIRIPKVTLDKLKKLAKKYGVSQSKIIERLVDLAE